MSHWCTFYSAWIRRQLIVNGGGGHGRVADRNTQLVEIRYDVAGRIQPFNAGLLMIINF